jgi:hypothetical protein
MALLDTCVLWPSTQRNFLLSLAVERLYRPVWSTAVLEELEYHEAEKLINRHGFAPDEADRRARRLVEQMRTHFADAETTGWEPLEGSFGLPDPDDEHVVAAAVVAGAGVIVTNNLKHFPAARLPGALEALPPPEFALNTVAVDPTRALCAVQAMADRSGRTGPVRSVPDVLGILEDRYRMVEAVALLREAADLQDT